MIKGNWIVTVAEIFLGRPTKPFRLSSGCSQVFSFAMEVDYARFSSLYMKEQIWMRICITLTQTRMVNM
jgi:hypothetical protein